MYLWIIIGILVGVVTLFLIVMSIKDRKKEKLRKIELIELEKKQKQARGNVIVFLDELIIQNNKMLDNFQPSIGKIKMKNIKNISRTNLLKYKKTEEYKLASAIKTNEKIIKYFKLFLDEYSNNWNKKLKKEINYIQKEVVFLDKEFQKVYRKEIKKNIEKELSNEFTK